MNNKIKISAIFMVIIAALLIIPNYSKAATVTANNEETLLSVISSANSGDTIELQNNITVTQPIVIAKELTIDGNGYTVAGSTDWTSTSGNQTMFTAQLSDAKLTLKDINLNNGPKYGVQSYDGATVILDNVSITGFRYGGVLVNGGKVEVKKLHLGYNGTGANNGIEIDKGASATNNPTLVMDGTLTSDTNVNIVRVASNGYLTEFTVTNTENTTNKVVIAGDSVLLTDASDNIISETELPEKVTANVDEQKAILTLIAGDQTSKIAVDLGATITQDLLKSHIELQEGYQVDGYFTNAEYTEQFNFNNPINADTTIYAKISQIQNNQTTENPTVNNTEKDQTPKTGIEDYSAIAVLALISSIIAIRFMKKRNIRG